jgi:hypothetical protein
MGGESRLREKMLRVEFRRARFPSRKERWPSGLRRTLGKRVYRKVPWVRIPLSPPESFRINTLQKLEGLNGRQTRPIRQNCLATPELYS